MQTTETVYCIKSDGSIVRRVVQDSTVEVADRIMNTLRDSSPVFVRDAMDLNGSGRIQIAQLGAVGYWSVSMPYLDILTSYQMIGGHLTPNFSASDNIMTMRWQPPNSMRVKFLVRVLKRANADYYSDIAWLLAFDSENKSYRLPLANLHDDARVCMGTFRNQNTTQLGLVTDCLEQLKKSPWNIDLWQSPEHTIALFRWLPEGKGFSIVHANDWRQHCNIISSPLFPYAL